MDYGTETRHVTRPQVAGNKLASSWVTDLNADTPSAQVNVNAGTMIGRQTIRVVIADADFTVRAGIRSLLHDSPHLEIVGEARDTQELLRVMMECDPDVVILDYALDNGEGPETIRLLLQAKPAVRCVVVGRNTKSRSIRAAFEAGAVAFVARDDDLADLAGVVKATSSGETFVSRKISQALLKDYSSGTDVEKRDPLTNRQKELLALVAQGKSSRAIGQMLGITVRTVHTHRSRIFKKLDIHTEAGLVYAAIRMGLVSVD